MHRAADDRQRVPQKGGLQVSQGYLGSAISALPAFDSAKQIRAARRQHLPPRAFEEAEVIGMVDEAAGIRILIINADRKMMRAFGDISCKRPTLDR